ncbi:MAG: protease complex subunit PrcB family protein [Elusimicrobia bacterium]|nr:protease complex subunit PrcB family protein [Elusimicrobiota bacterium]
MNRRLLLAAAVLAALGMARRPPEKKMTDPAALAAVDVIPAEWRGAQCAVTEPGARVINDAAAWAALWTSAFGTTAPAVDFKDYVAVAVFAGLKPSGGWSPEFLLPEAAAPGAVVVPYQIKGPGPGAFVTMAFTKPYAVRLYRRPALPLRAEERK